MDTFVDTNAFALYALGLTSGVAALTIISPVLYAT